MSEDASDFSIWMCCVIFWQISISLYSWIEKNHKNMLLWEDTSIVIILYRFFLITGGRNRLWSLFISFSPHVWDVLVVSLSFTVRTQLKRKKQCFTTTIIKARVHLFHSVNTILSAQETELLFLFSYFMGSHHLMFLYYLVKTLQEFNYLIALKSQRGIFVS